MNTFQVNDIMATFVYILPLKTIFRFWIGGLSFPQFFYFYPIFNFFLFFAYYSVFVIL